MTRGTIYNTTDGPLAVDRAGRVLGAREHREDVNLEDSPVAGHITAGRLIVTSSSEDQAAEAEPVEAAPAPKRGRRSTSTPTEEA